MLNKLYETWGVTNKHNLPEFTGYEDVLANLKLFTKEQYDKDPEKVTDEIFNIYRSINIVPITYFSQRGIENKIRELHLSIPKQVKDYTLGLGNNKGQDLIRFMFPNMMTAEPKGRGSNSLKEIFYDDTKLKNGLLATVIIFDKKYNSDDDEDYDPHDEENNEGEDNEGEDSEEDSDELVSDEESDNSEISNDSNKQTLEDSSKVPSKNSSEEEVKISTDQK